MALQHLVGFRILDFRILVRSCDEDRVAVFPGHGGYRVSTAGKEGVVEIRKDEADGMAALTTKCACQDVGTVLELLNRGLYPLCGFGGDANGTAERSEEH